MLKCLFSIVAYCALLIAVAGPTQSMAEEIGGCIVPTDGATKAFQACMASHENTFRKMHGQYYFCPTDPGFRHLPSGVSCRQFVPGLFDVLNITERATPISVAELIEGKTSIRGSQRFAQAATNDSESGGFGNSISAEQSTNDPFPSLGR